MDFLPMHAWHPMVVHFPLGLLLGGAALEAAGWLTRRPPLRGAGRLLLTAGVLLALLAIATGLLAYGRVDHSDAAHELMKLHRNLMLAAVGLFFIAVIWRWTRGDRVAATPTGSALYATLLAAASVLLVVAADRGAALVFEHGTGVATTRLEEVLHERDAGHGHAAPPSPPAATPSEPTSDAEHDEVGDTLHTH